MTPTFVSSAVKPISFTTSFSGTAVTSRAATPRARECTPRTFIIMADPLDKYRKMSQAPPSQPTPSQPSQPSQVPTLKPSAPSRLWMSFAQAAMNNFSPFRPKTEPMFSTEMPSAAFVPSSSSRSLWTLYKPDPDVTIAGKSYLVTADNYMAQCITKQYKMTAAPFGTYNVQCTEATIRGQANYARNLALSTDFRMRQRSKLQKFADYTETRRKAIIGAHGCSYEEKLLINFPVSARSYIRAGAEAKSICSRYATDSTAAETYMASSVVKQNMMRKVPNGVYDMMCSDGNVKDVAEYKRVQALAAQFRAAQQPQLVKEQVKFDSRKFARDNFGHLCSYKENLFNLYPMVSASMRPNSSY